MNFKKFANCGFKLESSGDDRKSISVAGVIKIYGFPLTITSTCPSNRYLVALSGLSVDNVTGTPYLSVSPN